MCATAGLGWLWFFSSLPPVVGLVTAQSRQSARLSLQSSEPHGSPRPLTRKLPPPPFGSKGGDTLAWGKELVGGANSDEGTDTLVLWISYLGEGLHYPRFCTFTNMHHSLEFFLVHVMLGFLRSVTNAVLKRAPYVTSQGDFQALLSLVYLCSSDIFRLITYVGFATWVRPLHSRLTARSFVFLKLLYRTFYYMVFLFLLFFKNRFLTLCMCY